MFGLTTTTEAKELTDEEVLKLSMTQPWLFAVLVDRYESAFLRKVLGVVRNRSDAEEVVQDTFTKIYIHADSYVPQVDAKFSSWAYRILLNTAFTRYQKLLKEGQRFISLDPDFEQFVGERSEHSGFSEHRDVIERILDRLPEHLAQVLRLHYLERWSQEDIAKMNNEKVGAVKVRIFRAKIAFRRESKEGEVEGLL